MYKIKPTVFSIEKEEIKEVVNEMVSKKILKTDLKLNKEQIIKILSYIEYDEDLIGWRPGRMMRYIRVNEP